MFDHVTIRVSDRVASERFYETVLLPLGVEVSYRTAVFTEWRDFSLAQADDRHPVTRNLHLAFVAPSREQVDAFWEAGRAAGYEDDGEPGPRPQYGGDYYGGFLRDTDGNSVEAVLHDGNVRRDGVIDHLWIRVSDLPASRAFYAAIAPHAGYEHHTNLPERAGFTSGSGSFSVLADGEPPTANVHIAFPATDDADVQAFHRTALGAGHRDNGAPGERPQYHPGYFAAFVLDPDGNNVEVVNHHRR